MVKTRVIRLRVKEGPKRVIKLRYVHSFSRSPNECWLHRCEACVITTWRLALRAALVARNNNIMYENDNNLKGYKYRERIFHGGAKILILFSSGKTINILRTSAASE